MDAESDGVSKDDSTNIEIKVNTVKLCANKGRGGCYHVNDFNVLRQPMFSLFSLYFVFYLCSVVIVIELDIAKR